MQKLISIDLFADFGMLKKPDTNEPVYLTFNMLHKPALLGILGAVAGLKGFEKKGELPDYYTELNKLKIGIQPIEKDEKTGKVFNENGNFQKTTIAYNNTTGMASKEKGGNLIVTEQTLVAPAFRCYFLLDLNNEIHQKIDKNLSNNHAEFLPYLGKNEFSVWWEKYREFKFEKFKPTENFKISSIFIKDKPVKEGKAEEYFDLFADLSGKGNSFIYFEHLPIGYAEIATKQYQYEFRNFAFSDWAYKPEYKPGDFTLLKTYSNGQIIQVF